MVLTYDSDTRKTAPCAIDICFVFALPSSLSMTGASGTSPTEQASSLHTWITSLEILVFAIDRTFVLWGYLRC